MDNKNKVRMLAEGGMMIALAILLSRIKIYKAPQGGSVTAGSMVPLMIFAIRWGLGPGLLVGAVYGLLDFIIEPSFFHWAQFLLDYIIAYGALGFAGIAHNSIKRDYSGSYVSVIIGSTLAIFIRMLCHVLSGVIFFSEYAGTQNPWIYSIVYNATYLIPELIISMIVLVLVWKPLQKASYSLRIE